MKDIIYSLAMVNGNSGVEIEMVFFQIYEQILAN